MIKKAKNVSVSTDFNKIKNAEPGDKFIVFHRLESKEGEIEEIKEVDGITFWKVKYVNNKDNDLTQNLLPFADGNTIVFPEKVTTKN